MRVCFVSAVNTLGARNGSAEYLTQIAELMRSKGHLGHLLILHPHHSTQLRARVGALDHYSQFFERVHHKGAIRLGDWLYTLKPLAYLGRLRSLLMGSNGEPTAGRRWHAPLSQSDLRWVRRHLERIGADLVVANYFSAVPAIAYVGGRIPRVLIAHDVLELRQASYRDADVEVDFSPELIQEERKAFSQVELAIAIKPTEADHISSVCPDANVLVIQPTYHVTGPSNIPHPAAVPTVIFVGMDFKANQDALKWLIDTVWPGVVEAHPNAILRVVGTVARSLPNPVPSTIEVVGFVDDIAPEYERATVAVVPVLFGSGINVKLVEALTFGVPVVATSVATEGIQRAPSGAVLTADSSEAFARAISAVISDADHLATRRAALEYARANFGFERAADDLERELSLLRAESPPASGP